MDVTRRVNRSFTAHPKRRRGFDFTAHMRLLCADVVCRLPNLNHIDPCSMAVAFCQTRKPVAHGLYATLTPMRFENGERFTIQHGQRFKCQQLIDAHGNEYLYILSFYLPRFLDVAFNEKLVTICHELWHISPRCDGDLRRHPGRCYIHTGSQEQFDEHARSLANRWLALSPPESLYAFLHLTFQQLQARHGPIYGAKIPHPKLIPCPTDS